MQATINSDSTDSRFYQLLAGSPHGILLTDEQGLIACWNRAMEQLTGFPETSVVGQTIWTVQANLLVETDETPHLRAAHLQLTQTLLAQGTAAGAGKTSQFWIRDAGGGLKLLEASLFALKTAQGFQIVGSFRDMTAEHRDKRQLKVLTQTIEQSPVSVVVTNNEGVIEYGNPLIQDLTGYALDEVLGQTPSIFKSGLTPASTYEDLWQTIKHGQIWRGELQNRKKNGELFWESIRISPVVNEEGEIEHFIAVKEDITRQKQVEQELRNSEQRFRAIFEQAGAGIVHTAPDGRFLSLNQKFCELLGYNREELLGKTFRDITHPEDLPTDLVYHKQLLNHEITEFTREKRYVRQDKTTLWVQLTVSLIWDEKGSPDYFIAVIQDISSLKAALQALEQSEFNLKRSQAIAHVGDWTWYTRSNTVRWSDEMYPIFGIDQATFTGELNAVIEMSIHPEDQPGVFAANQAVIGKRKPAPMEYRIVRKDGTIRYLYAQPGDWTLDDQGNILTLSGIVQDITHQKLAEMASQEAHQQLELLHEALQQQNLQLEQMVNERTTQLRGANRRLKAILNTKSDAILMLRPNGEIEIGNTSSHRLFGYDWKELVKQPIYMLVDNEAQDRLQNGLKSVRLHKRNERIELKMKRKNGLTFDADIALARIKGHGNHIVCSIRDISHFREIERAKDAFISMVSHELRTPVASINLSAEMLINYYDKMPDERRLQKLQQLHHHADVLNELVTSILDTARYNNGKNHDTHTQVDLQQVLKEVIDELLPQAEVKEQRLETVVDAQDSLIFGNRIDFARVWRNLINNAIKYSEEGKIVRIRVCHSDELASSDTLANSLFKDQLPAAVSEGQYIIGVVEDNGPGIHSDDLSQLFTRFFRGWAANTNIPGTGLGLSLVKEIIQDYQGDIIVRSQLGEGTAFCFWLPLRVA